MNKIDIRWLIGRDMLEVTRTERVCFGDEALTRDDLVALQRGRGMNGAVAVTERNAVLGHCLYRITDRVVEIVRIAVHPIEQRQGVGAAIVERMVQKLDTPETRRLAVVARIPEDNLPMLLLMQHMGFIATDVLRGVVVMTYSLDDELCRWRSPAVRELVGG